MYPVTMALQYSYKISHFFEDLCAVGYGRNGDSCTKCPVGFYKSREDKEVCRACPADRTTASTGTSDYEDCGKYTRIHACGAAGEALRDHHTKECYISPRAIKFAYDIIVITHACCTNRRQN